MIFDAAVAWLCAEFWLTRSPSPKKRETKKKKTGGGRRERKRSRQKEETALCLCQGLKGKTLASSHQELKQKQLINRARQIQSPCKLNTSPSSSFLSSNIPPPPNTFVFSLPSVFVTSLCVCVCVGGDIANTAQAFIYFYLLNSSEYLEKEFSWALKLPSLSTLAIHNSICFQRHSKWLLDPAWHIICQLSAQHKWQG